MDKLHKSSDGIITESKIRGAAKWSLMTEVFARLTTPIANMILARLLLPEAFGLVATITMVLSFAEIFTDAGFQKYIIQHDFKDNDNFLDAVQVAFWSNVTLAFVISLSIFFFRDRIAYVVGNADLGLPIATAGSTILFNAVSSVHIGVFKRQFEFKKLFYVRLAVSLVPIFITVPAAYILRSFWALVVGNISKSIVQAMIIIPSSKVGIRFYYSQDVFRKMFAFSFWTIVESITIWLTGNVDVFIIGRVLDEYYLGLYKTAILTISNYVGIIAAAITAVLFSTLSRYQNNKELFLNTYFKFQHRLAIFVIPFGVGIFVFRDLVTRILLGTNWLKISDFLGAYALLNVFVIETCYFASEIFRSKGEPKISVIYQSIMIIIQIPVIFFSAKQGFEVMCKVRIGLGIFFVFLALIFGRVRYGIRIIDVFMNLGLQTMSAIIMGIFGMCLLHISDIISMQFIWIILCIVIYFCCLLLTSKSIRNDVLNAIDRTKGNM